VLLGVWPPKTRCSHHSAGCWLLILCGRRLLLMGLVLLVLLGLALLVLCCCQIAQQVPSRTFILHFSKAAGVNGADWKQRSGIRA
jgi:hypothetical protein